MKLILILLVGMLTPLAFGMCPQGDDVDFDKIELAISSSKSCHQASNYVFNCAFGSVADVYLVSEATKVCLGQTDELNEETSKAKNVMVNQCVEKFKNSQGSLYRSLEAMCRLKVHVAYQAAYSSVEY